MKKYFSFLKITDTDEKNVIKRKQHLWIALFVTSVIVVFALVFSGAEKGMRKPKKEKVSRKTVVNDLVQDRDVWAKRLEGEALKMATLVQSFKAQNELQAKRLKNLEDALLQQVKEKGASKRSASVEKTTVPLKRETVSNSPFSAPDFENTFSQNAQRKTSSPFEKGSEENERGFQKASPKILHLSASGVSDVHHARDYVVSGTYAKAVLTAGVTVSTAVSSQGQPQPIIMRLQEGGNMPRGWKSKVKDAVLIGSCFGDISSERALCRLQSLSLIQKDGKVFETPVEGWIIGEDGSPGLRGTVVDPSGKVVREAFLSGILSGMGSFFKNSAQSAVYPVSPFGQTNALKNDDVLKSGAAQGASNALEKLADFSIKRAEAMSPVLVVHPGRVVDVVFKKGFSLNRFSSQRGHHIKSVKSSSSSKKGVSYD